MGATNSFNEEASNQPVQNLPEVDLSAYYAGIDDPQIESDIAHYRTLLENFTAKYKGRIAGLDGSEMLECLHETDVRYALAAKIGGYFSILESKNYDKHHAQTDGIDRRLRDIDSRAIFFGLELAKLPPTRIPVLLAEEPGLAKYRVTLENAVKAQPHILGEEAETVLSKFGPLMGWGDLYSKLDTMPVFEFEGKKLVIEEILNIRAYAQDRETRCKANESFYKGLQDTMWLRAFIMNKISLGNEIKDEVRNYPHPVARRNMTDNIPDALIDIMNGSINRAYPRISHRFYELKRQLLGLDKLKGYDRNAPLPFKSEEKVSYADAKQMVLDGYRDFSPVMADMAQEFFDNNWIDAAVTPGKQSGAFSSSMSVDYHPVVFVNFLGNPRDVSVIAHELGHGIHQRLAAQHLKSEMAAETPLTVAETASIFGERMVFERLLAATTDPQERAIILYEKINDMINSVVRQNAFFNFEKKLHAVRKTAGQDLDADTISKIYMETQKEALGPAFDLDDEYGIEWSYIPHFIHTPYYVRAYAFGDNLVNSLFDKYLESDNREEFARKYMELLKAGGTVAVTEAVRPFGLDLTDPGFWDGGMKTIETMIDRLEVELVNAGKVPSVSVAPPSMTL